MPVPFDPLKPLGPPWTYEAEMELFSAVVVALETMGWHPCPAIKAGWTAVDAICKEHKLKNEYYEQENSVG